MENLAVKLGLSEEKDGGETRTSNYHSVEFLIHELAYTYQFKIWNMDPRSMHIIIKEDSDILNCLKVGNRFRIRCYSAEMLSSSKLLETEVKNITKDDEGKFKGHYIVHLSIEDHLEKSFAH